MAKFYVESGPEFRVVIEAEDAVQAIVRALAVHLPPGPVRLANVVIANEQGFVWDREGADRFRGDEIVLPTEDLFTAIRESLAEMESEG